jgi:hypothetical protein
MQFLQGGEAAVTATIKAEEEDSRVLCKVCMRKFAASVFQRHQYMHKQQQDREVGKRKGLILANREDKERAVEEAMAARGSGAPADDSDSGSGSDGSDRSSGGGGGGSGSSATASDGGDGDSDGGVGGVGGRGRRGILRGDASTGQPKDSDPDSSSKSDET